MTLIRATTDIAALAVGLWVLVGVLLPPVDGVITCSNCEKGSYLTCPDSFRMQFSVSLYPYNGLPDRLLHLTCDYETKDLNFTMLEGCSFPLVTYVRIVQCPLFNQSLGNVFSEIGVDVNNIRSLQWETSHSVENGLQSWHLDNLPNLTYVQMQDNYFTSLPKEFLKKTPLLEMLYVTGNYLSELPNDILAYTPELLVAELGNNGLQSLPDNLLANVPSLQILNLWDNRLTSIPANFLANNQQLTSVVLTRNKLTSIEPGLFVNLKNLSSVDLNINELETLPESTFEGCVNLKTLTFEHNKISHLPPKIFQGTSLQVLNLGYNKLENVSFFLNNLETLENVTLYKNNLKILEAEMFTGSPNIIRLDFQANGIERLGHGIFDYLNKMKIILLNNNMLHELPPGLFRDCLALIRIFLQKNSLTTIPFDTFPEYSDIVKLDLSSNRLSFEGQFTPLNKLTKIEELYLANNMISSIFDDALYVFLSLRHLDLRNNSIDALTDRDLSFISQNVTLLLQDNKVANIQTTKFLSISSRVEKYMYISLAGNPLNCDCKMYNFLTTAHLRTPHIKVKNSYNLIVQDAEQTLCLEPENYFNASLVHVNRTKIVCKHNCSLECSCDIRTHDRILLIDCSNRNLSEPPELFIDPFIREVISPNLSLNISRNNYEDLSFLGNLEYENLTKIDVTYNAVTELNETFLPDNLREMDLRFNNFTMMSKGLVDHLNHSRMELQLGGNPWSCDCGLVNFHEFIRDNYELVRDRQNVVCTDGGEPVDELTTEQLCSFLHQPAALASIVAGALLMLMVAVLVTAAWYRHKELVKVWLYSRNMCLWAVTEHEIDADKKYDAFISYSYKDEGFVNSILVPGLESGDPKYRVCLHYRDWIPGEYIQDQILSSVRASRRTIVVLSKNFIESVWGQLEFKAAHSQALKDKTNRIIIVVYGDVPGEEELDGELKLYVSINTYLKWGDQRFWERLRYAMPHAKYAPYKKTKVDKLELVKPAPQTAVKTVDA